MFLLKTLYKELFYFIENRRHVVEIPSADGFPDGMCIDAEGMLWVALYNGSSVNRYNPNTGNLHIQFPTDRIRR